jgi:hypothetical protein
MKYAMQHRVELISLMLQMNGSSRMVCDTFAARHPDLPVPSHSTVIRLLERFKATGNVADLPRCGAPKTTTDGVISESVLLNFVVKPHTSTRQAAAYSGVGKSSVHRILKKNKFHPYPYCCFMLQILITDWYSQIGP